jgi:L-ascorbate metabolism protein UlaG (beta-lactamase superfamily)
MDITRFGHAALLVETETTRILLDPGTFCDDAVFELTDLDAIVVTHQHPDHLDQDRVPGLLANNAQAQLICDPETADLMDVGSWTPNADGLEHVVGDVTVTGVGAQHAVILPEIDRIANVGVLVAAGGTTVFHPGDTYEHAPQGVDVLALPLGAPWAKLSETVEFVQRVAPRAVLPIHDRTIADLAYPMYWGQVAAHGGVDDARQLGQSESTQV